MVPHIFHDNIFYNHRSLADSRQKAIRKPAHLCANCIARLHGPE